LTKEDGNLIAKCGQKEEVWASTWFGLCRNTAKEGKGRGGPNTPEPVSISMEGKKARIK